MNERDFVYWLQGFLEVSGTSHISTSQLQIIKDHLALVLKKVTPEYSGITFLENLAKLRNERDDLLCSIKESENPASLTEEELRKRANMIKNHLTC